MSSSGELSSPWLGVDLTVSWLTEVEIKKQGVFLFISTFKHLYGDSLLQHPFLVSIWVCFK